MKTTYERKCIILLALYIRGDKARAFLFHASIHNEELPNPTLGDSHTVQRGEEVIGGSAPLPGEHHREWGRSSGTKLCGMRKLPRERNSFLTPGAVGPSWPRSDHLGSLIQTVSEMLSLVHRDNSKVQRLL